jgi:hypothetical protein
MANANKYGKLVNRTPESLRCGVGPCPAIYEVMRGGKPKKMLVIGKRVDPRDAGLAKNINRGEVLIEVPAAIFSDLKRR